MLFPSNSYLIKPSIVSERNKAAVENVFIIVQLIEQAGDKGIAHIKAKTLIERNEALKARLKKSTNPVQLLRRVFKKTWQLLREQTLLLEVYEDIELPDPDDITQTPTFADLDHVFMFRHKGKKKRIYAPNLHSILQNFLWQFHNCLRGLFLGLVCCFQNRGEVL